MWKLVEKNSEQKQVISNLEKLYKSREEVLNLFRDFTNMVFEAKYKAKRATGLQILTPKQRLPTALAQVKAGNNSENLLNENMINWLLFVLIKKKNY